MKRNLEVVLAFIVLAGLLFAVLLVNANDREEELRNTHAQETFELRNTINSQQLIIDNLNATVESQEEVIQMKEWQLQNLEPSEDR